MPLCKPAWRSGDASVQLAHWFHSKHAKSWRLPHHQTPLWGAQTVQLPVCAPETLSYFFHLCREGLNNRGELFGPASTSILDWLERPRVTGTCGVFTLGTQGCPTCCCLSRNKHQWSPVTFPGLFSSGSMESFCDRFCRALENSSGREMVQTLTVTDSRTEVCWIVIEDDPSNGWETMFLKKQRASLLLLIQLALYN